MSHILAVALAASALAADDRSLRWLEDPDDEEVVEWAGERNGAALEWLDENDDLDGVVELARMWRVEMSKRRTVLDAVEGVLLVSESHPDPGNGSEPEMKLWRYHASLQVESASGVYEIDLADTGTESWWRLCEKELSPDGQWVLWGRRRPEPDPLDPNKKLEPCLLFLTKVGSDSHLSLGEYRRGYPKFSDDSQSVLFTERRFKHTRITRLDLAGQEQEVLLARLGCWSRANQRNGDVVVWRARRCTVSAKKWRPHSLVVDGQTRRYRLPRIQYRWAGYHEDTHQLMVRVEKGAAENERVVALSPGWSRPRGWQTWLEDSELEPFRSVAWVGDRFVVTTTVDGAVRLTEHTRDSASVTTPVRGPFSHAWLSNTTGELALVQAYSPRGQQIWARTRAGEYTPVQSRVFGVPAHFEQVLAVSADGTEVPVSMVMPKGLVPDEHTPVWLKAYGGFGNSVGTHVGTGETLWLQLGGIIATVHARGGRERGEEWHEQARKADLALTYEDVAAAGQWFVDSGWSSPGRLVLSGFSNGGLTAAATVVRNPDMFGAVLAGSGVHDLLRGPAMGRWWPDEYGRPSIPEQRRVLASISPVHAEPARLPPIWITTGESDPTVTPSHSFKLAASWQDVQGGPVLLRTYPWPSHISHLDGKEREAADAVFGVPQWDQTVAEQVLFFARALELDLDRLHPPPDAELDARPAP